ncbi:MAG: hypothetical protein J6V00_00445 [Bacteroidaceae bacterium]|nr:hypothetical protein [Bacteroidaceae bacterium]
MATNNYIVAIEIGSSKISCAVGIQTYSGINILAYASEPVNGFVSKGVVRNVDETGNCLNSLINRLEPSLDNLTIEKAYVAFGGLSMHTRKSTVVRTFDEYTKVTQSVIEQMALENDQQFAVPDGYQRIMVLPLESRLNGETSLTPMGIPTRRIECNYQNILLREQYMKQLEESFAMSNICILDSYNAIILEANILLSDTERSSGAALVNIGAETTTVAIYTNNLLRKLVVIPIGSNNITRDLCAEQIPYKEAEQLKIFKGYNSTDDDNSIIETELVNQIISARMSEILLNVKHQIEEAENRVANIVFTGGGSKLKNIMQIIQECLPNFKTRIANEESYSYNCAEELSLGSSAITPALYGLLLNGKENCCNEFIQTTPEQFQTDLFGDPVVTDKAPDNQVAEKEKEKEEKTENNEDKTPKSGNEKAPETPKPPKKQKPSKVFRWFNELIDNVTNDEEDTISEKE